MESVISANATNDTSEFFSILTTDSGESRFRRPLAVNIVVSIMIFISAIVGAAGNGAVIVASYTSETLKNQTGNLFVAYLSVIDFLTAFLIMLPTAISVAADRWVLGDIICKIQSASIHTLYTASSGAMALISIDRLIAVSYPLRYESLITKNAIYIVCAINSLVCVTAGFFSVYIMKDLIKYMDEEICCFVDYDNSNSHIRRVLAYIVVVCFYIPSTIIAVSYTIIIILVRKSNNKVHAISVRKNDRDISDAIQKDRNQQKVIKSMIIVAALYFLIYMVTISVLSYKQAFKTDTSPWPRFIGNCLMVNSAAINPLIYAIFRKDYRDAFKKIFKNMLETFHIHRF